MIRVAVFLLVFSAQLFAADFKGLNPVDLDIDQMGALPPPREKKQSTFEQKVETHKDVIYGALAYKVQQVLSDREIVVRVETDRREKMRWEPVVAYFVLSGIDASRLADDKPVIPQGVYKVTKTRRFEKTMRTLYVIEPVK